MKDVETDLETLRENWTPKQKENWENHGAPKFKKLDYLIDLAVQNDGNPEEAARHVELAKKWYLRAYRPKKQGDGMMERDHVKVGQPERYFIKFRQKLNDAYMSVHSMMMEGPFLSEEVRDECETAATALFMCQGIGGPEDAIRLQKKLDDLEEVGELYGIN